MTKIKESSTNFENKQTLETTCNVIYATNLLRGQWTMAVCCALSKGRLRFSEIKRAVPGITERMLTLELRKMEDNGLVTRTVYAEVPPRVEYELTPITHELDPVIESLEAWGLRHKERVGIDVGERCKPQSA